MKKIILFFGIVAISLLMISSATATIIPPSIERSRLNSDSVNSCVTSGMYISGPEQRKILSDSLRYIDDSDAYQLVQAILIMMDSKGFVNSEDIEQIVNGYNLEFTLIAGIGCPITTGAYPNPGYTIRVGHPFQNSGTVILGVLFWNAKHSYNPARNIDITITLSGAQQHIIDDKMGLCIGFSGTFARGEEETGRWFTIQGSALMHLVY